MHNIVNNFISIQDEIKKNSPTTYQNINIIAVSKTFSKEHIKPLIDHGHNHFGENKVQEALDKWTTIKSSKENLNLHLIGKLQTNKVKFAVKLFDYIHSLDNSKLANKIASEEKKLKKKIKIFIQVNIGDETQKSGVNKKQLSEFHNYCTKDLHLNIIGLMCIPPNENNSKTFFSEMKNLNKSIGLENLSMGMSNDYIDALNNGSNFLRIGSKIFGSRV